jgi:small-conductance mechanosensitive channel
MDKAFNNLIRIFSDEGTVDKIVVMFIILVILFILRFVIGGALKNARNMALEKKRRYLVNLNTLLTFVFLCSIFVIWTDELRSLVFSLTAILVALVIATKEFLMNFFGGLFKMTQNSFHVGDRIEVDGVRGDVIDRTFLATTLMEIGPGKKTHQLTGRSVVIPNSVFLSKTVINESYLKNFVLHTFNITISNKDDWERAESILLERCHHYCGEFFEAAQTYLNRLHLKSHLEVPVLKPRVHINILDHEKLELITRITAPAAIKGRIEQKIVKDFLREFYKK